MFILLPLLAVLIPLLITPGLLFYFDVTPKAVLVLLGTVVALLPFRSNARNLRALWAERTGRWFLILMAAQFLSLGWSALQSSNVALSLYGGTWRRFGLIPQGALLLFAVLATAWLAQNPGQVRWLLRAIICGGALAAAYGILQYFGFDPLMPLAAYQAGEGPFTIVRPPGTLGHADYFATYLLFVVFGGVALRRWEVSALAVAAIVLSGTRAALAGLVVGAILWIVLSRPRIRMVPAAVVFVALALFYFSPAGEKLRARTHWSIDDARGGARLPLWRDCLRMAAERPLSGYGPETFLSRFPLFQSVELSRAYPDFHHESPHNIFLDALVSQGVPGLLILLGLCGLGGFAGRRAPPAVLAAFLAVAAAQMFSVFILPTAFFFYLTLGMMVAYDTRVLPPDGAGSTGVAAILSLAAAVPCLILGLILAVRLLASDAMLAVTKRAFDAGDVQRAAASYTVVRRWQPPGSSADLYYSRSMMAAAARQHSTLLKLQAWQQAGFAASSATTTSEDPANAWYNLSVFYGMQDDAPGAEASLRAAIAASPQWYQPHLILGQVLRAEGRTTEAAKETEAAASLHK